MTIRDAKRNVVIDAAIRLFLEKSIAAVTIRDIAQRSGVGEATVYRYFVTRSELVIACALKLQEEVTAQFLATHEGLTGYERLRRFYEAYLTIFCEKLELYRFLSEFDAYCISEGVAELDEYADNMDRFKDAFMAAYRDGVADKTVRPADNIDLFYYATTHAVLSLCKKLATEGRMLRQDAVTDKAMEIRTLIDIILASRKVSPL